MNPTLWILAPLVVASLAACTTYAPRGLSPGAGPAEVRRQLGEPTDRHALAGGGSRLEFARGPFGKHTYMVDLDAQQRVTGWEQVLTEANFAEVAPGMPADELRRTLGRPAQRRAGGWQGGEVWSYRYDAVFCQWFQVSVIDARVRDTAYTPDPLCDVNDHEIPTR